MTPPHATPAAPVGGALYPNQSDISRVIHENRSDIQTCYQRALLEDHRLTHGKITVRVAIATSGQVKNVEIEGPTEFQSLEPCIKERIGLWSFPPSPEQYGTEFVYVFQGDEHPTAATETGKEAKPDPELDPGAVAKYVRSQVPNVKACYESALKIDPTLVGRIDTHWTIDADGVPRDVAVASGSMQGSGVADCVRALIEGWRFPKPAGRSIEVSFPFVFQSHD